MAPCASCVRPRRCCRCWCASLSPRATELVHNAVDRVITLLALAEEVRLLPRDRRRRRCVFLDGVEVLASREELPAAAGSYELPLAALAGKERGLSLRERAQARADRLRCCGRRGEPAGARGRGLEPFRTAQRARRVPRLHRCQGRPRRSREGAGRRRWRVALLVPRPPRWRRLRLRLPRGHRSPARRLRARAAGPRHGRGAALTWTRRTRSTPGSARRRGRQPRRAARRPRQRLLRRHAAATRSRATCVRATTPGQFAVPAGHRRADVRAREPRRDRAGAA